jgi:hypothetical protein
MSFGGLTYNSNGINSLTIVTILFLILPDETKITIFSKFQKILAIVFLLGLISYFILLFINFNSFTIHPKNSLLRYDYIVYWVSINSVEPIMRTLPRFMSLFDEPGVVGTLAALLISYRKFSFKSFEHIVFFIAGLMSFSLTFYIIILLNLIFNRLISSKLLIASIISVFLLFSFNSEQIDYYFFNRIKFIDGKLSGDNRTTQDFDMAYNKFLKEDAFKVAFGVGYDELSAKQVTEWTYSYKILVFEYGIIGFLSILSFFSIAAYKIAPNKEGMFFLLVFILLAYQRINIFSFFNILIFFGGLNVIAHSAKYNSENNLT